MKRKHALRHAYNLARNVNRSAYMWWNWRAETYTVTAYLPPRGWVAKWAEVSHSGEIKIFKLREWRKVA